MIPRIVFAAISTCVKPARFTLPVMLGLFALTATSANAALIEVPYAGGKKSGTVVVPASSSSNPPIDTVRIGNVVVRIARYPGPLPTVCGAKPMTMVQFFAPFGMVQQTSDTSTDWNALTTWPASGLVAVDTVAADDGTGASDVNAALHAPGFRLFEAGETNSCTNDEYFMQPNWNRVVFLRYGSGVDYRAKLSFQAVTDSSYHVTPMIQGTIIQSLRLHYVLNANSTNVEGAPVSLRRPERPVRALEMAGPRGVTELYNPLGARLQGERGRHEVALPLQRASERSKGRVAP